jgi:DNA polymerase III psi subunit
VSQPSPVESLYQEEIYRLDPKVLVMLSRTWNEISSADRLLLEKILSAVKLSLAMVQIITAQEYDLPDLVAYAPAQIITFGPVLRQLPTQYELLSVDGTSIIQAEALDKLNEAKKKSLWGALKQMFSR